MIASAADITAALVEKYAPPAWATFTNVSNGTGYASTGFADVLAMSLYPSRGLGLEGFEIKVSRGDWLRELKKPKKAEQFFRFCRAWWVVAVPRIVELAELPPTWGLILLRGKGTLRVEVPAPALRPSPFTPALIAAILRRAEQGMRPRLEAEFTRGLKKGQDYGPEEHRRERARVADERDRLRDIIADFEKKSGLRLDSYNHGEIGEVVRELSMARNRLVGWRLTDPVDELTRLIDQVETTAKRLTDLRDYRQKVAVAAAELPELPAAADAAGGSLPLEEADETAVPEGAGTASA